jgi:hypothetical protein
VTDVKSSASAQPTTREQRGIQIARERADEIWPCGEGYWRVPGSDGETVYLVDVGRESCSCEDHTRTRRSCKHLFAVLAVRAKRSCHCFGGYVTITVEEDGQERDEAVPCRRCNR